MKRKSFGSKEDIQADRAYIRQVQGWLKTQDNAIESCELNIRHAQEAMALMEKKIKLEQEEIALKRKSRGEVIKQAKSVIKRSGIKGITLACLLLLTLASFAQPVRRSTGWASTTGGVQYQVTVPISQWGHTNQAIIYAPQDHPLPNGKYPVILFFHGVGEAGTDPSRLLSQGLPAAIVKKEPIGLYGKDSVKFLVLSLQDQWFSPPIDWVPYALEWLKKSYPIDTNFIYVSGLSAGGMNSFNAALKYPNLIAAAAPMSMAGYDAALTSSYKLPTWFFVGRDDSQYGAFTEGALKAISSPVEKLTKYPGGHCCWEAQYTTELFSWFLANSKAPAISPITPIPITEKKVVATITVTIFEDGTWSVVTPKGAMVAPKN